jgi:thioester reductase-like protein
MYLGVYQLIRLAMTNHFKPIHHVSTVGVFISNEDLVYSRDRKQRFVREADGVCPLAESPIGYLQSKIVAEKILTFAAASLCVPISIYRPEPVSYCPHSQNWNRTKPMRKYFER